MKRLDFNCFTGNWPFHKVRYNTVAKITELHKRVNIEGGIISSLEAIFYQDPYEAEKALAKELKGTSYMHAMILNPMLPGWKDDLARAQKELDIKAIRLMPGFHNYLLTDAVMDEVADAVRACKLPLIITLRMEDERTTWMFHPKTVDMNDVVAFLEKNPDIITIVANIRFHQLAALEDQFNKRFNLFVDISGFKDGLFTMEKAWQSTARDHLIYGSLAPIFELQSTSILLDAADIGPDAKETIFSGNGLLELMKL